MRLPERVLVFGRDYVLLESRRLVLQTAGFEVDVATSIGQVRDQLSSKNKPLLVLCHSLPTEECQMALEAAHQAIPKETVLVLTAGEPTCVTHSEHQILSALDGPAVLVNTVRRLLRPAPDSEVFSA